MHIYSQFSRTMHSTWTTNYYVSWKNVSKCLLHLFCKILCHLLILSLWNWFNPTLQTWSSQNQTYHVLTKTYNLLNF